jgi:hypothetical protein
MGAESPYRNRRGDGELRGPDGIANALFPKHHYPGNEFLTRGRDRQAPLPGSYRRCVISVTGSKSTGFATLHSGREPAAPGVLAIVDADFATLEGQHPRC